MICGWFGGEVMLENLWKKYIYNDQAGWRSLFSNQKEKTNANRACIRMQEMFSFKNRIKSQIKRIYKVKIKSYCMIDNCFFPSFFNQSGKLSSASQFQTDFKEINLKRTTTITHRLQKPHPQLHRGVDVDGTWNGRVEA